MNRRHFITLSGAAGMAAITASTVSTARAAQAGSGRDYYQLLQFIVENEGQKKKLDTFLKEAAIPALNRLGSKPVGVFYPADGISPVYVLLRHKSLETVATLNADLAADGEFTTAGEEFLNAPAGAPAFKRLESSLMVAFDGMPQIETPVTSPGRVFQLRIYESPSVVTGLKKIEMFNDAGEIKLFRETGLNPVFFGQTIIGTKMPNLTYMLAFKNMDEQKAAWKKFVAHPEWKRLSGMPEYADKAILSGITNLQLVAADYSQV
jgi:hypothetical protein